MITRTEEIEGTPGQTELYTYHIGGRDEKSLDLVNTLLDLGKRVA